MLSLRVRVTFLLGVVFRVIHAEYMPVCDPANYAGSPSIPLPNLPEQFFTVIEANLGQENSTTNVREYFDEIGNRGRFEITRYGLQTVGIFDYNNGEIFRIWNGDTCEVSMIADPSTRNEAPLFGFLDSVNGSVHVGTVRDFLQLRDNNVMWLGTEVVRGILCNHWQTCTVLQNNSYTLDYYFATESWDFGQEKFNGSTPVQVILNALIVKEGIPEPLNHIYSFVSFDIGPRSVPDEAFTVPFDLICSGRIPGLPIPSIPEYFSATIEAVQRTTQSVLVYKEFYDFPKRLSRVDVYYDGYGRAGDRPGQLSIIRDTARNIEYVINRQLHNCTVVQRDFDVVYFYALEGTSQLVAELSTPPELLAYIPLFPYTYEGATNVRGVTVDVWIGLISATPYEFTTPNLAGYLDVRNLTYKVFFTKPGWRITSDRTVYTEPTLWRLIVNAHSTYTNYTDNVTTSGDISGVYDIIDFSTEEPDFDIFDISTCFSPSDYHILSIAIPGHEQGLNFSQLRNNLRSAIVDYSDIQPLQVGNIQITGENGTHIFVSLHISNTTQLARVEDSKTADEILQMIQRNTVNGRLPFQILTGLGTTVVTPLLLNVNPQVCDTTDDSCFGLNTGQSVGLGIGLFVVGLACGILGTFLILLVIKLSHCSKSKNPPKDSPISYEKQADEVSVK